MPFGFSTFAGAPFASLAIELVHRSLSATSQSFSLTGFDAGGTKERRLYPDRGLFTLAGTVTGVIVGKRVIGTVRTYDLTGNVSITKKGFWTSNPSRTFSLSGTATNFKWNKVVSGAVRTYSLSGLATGLRRTGLITGTARTFALSGITTTTKKGFYTAGAVRTFSLNGIVAGTFKGFRTVNPVRTFALTGVANDLDVDRRVSTATVAFSLVGTATGVRRANKIFADVRTYSLVGISTVIKRGFYVSGAVRAFSLSGITAGTNKGFKTVNAVRTYALSGTITGTHKGFRAINPVRTFAFTGNAGLFKRIYHIDAVTRTYSLTGPATSKLVKAWIFSVDPGFGRTIFGVPSKHPTERVYWTSHPMSMYWNFLEDGEWFDSGAYEDAGASTFTTTGYGPDGVFLQIVMPEAGAFTYSGSSATVGKGFYLAANTRSFSYVGNAQTYSWTRRVTGTVRTYSLAGLGTGVRAARTLPTAVRTHTLSGIVAITRKGFKAVNPVRTFSLSGIATNLDKGFRVINSAGTFSLTGNVSLSNRDYVVTGTQRTYSLAGTSSGTRASRVVLGSTRTYTLVGIATTTKRGLRTSATAVSFALSGIAAGSKQNRVVTGVSRTYALNGAATSLLKDSRAINPVRAYALTGTTTVLKKGFYVASAIRSFSVVGISSSILPARRILSLKGSYILTGNANSWFWTRAITQQTVSFSTNGLSSTFVRAYVFPGAIRSYSLSGIPTGTRKGFRTVNPVRAYALTGVTNTLKKGFYIAGAIRTYSLAGIVTGTRKGFHTVANSGTFAATFHTNLLERGYVFPTNSRTFAVAGTPTSLAKGLRLIAEILPPNFFTHQMPVLDSTAMSQAWNWLEDGEWLDSGIYDRRVPSSFNVAFANTGTYISQILFPEIGSFIASGPVQSLLKHSALSATTGSFSHTGTEFLYNRNYNLVAEPAQDTGIFGAPRMEEDADPTSRYWNFLEDGEWFESRPGVRRLKSGFYIQTYTNALTFTRSISAASASFAATGIAVKLNKGFRIAQAIGSFSFVGTDTKTLHGSKVLGTLRTYSLAGTITEVRATRGFFGTAGTYSFNGIASSWFRTYVTKPVSGVFTAVANPNSFNSDKNLGGTTGQYILSGKSLSFFRAYVLLAEGTINPLFETPIEDQDSASSIQLANYLEDGEWLDTNAWLKKSKSTFDLTNNNGTLIVGKVLRVSVGNITVSSVSPVLAVGRVSEPLVQHFYVTGASVVLPRNYVITAEYANPPGLFGSVTSVEDEFYIQRYAKYLEDGEWFDSYPKTIILRPSFLTQVYPAQVIKGYALEAAVGAFIRTGVAAKTLKGSRVIGAVRTYSLAGVVNKTLKNSKVLGAVHTYSLTGIENVFRKDRVIKSFVSAFNIVDSTTDLDRDSKLLAGAGTFALIGTDADKRIAFWTGLVKGTFSVSGTATKVLASHKTAILGTNYAFAGNSVDTRYGYTLIPSIGRYSLVGKNAKVGRTFFTKTLQFLATGKDLDLAKGRFVVADVGSYSVTMHGVGKAQRFNLGPVTGQFYVVGNVALKGRTLFALGHAFSVSTSDTILPRTRVLLGVKGDFSVSLSGSAKVHTFRLAAQSGSFGLLGIDVTRNFTVSAQSLSIEEVGKNVAFRRDFRALIVSIPFTIQETETKTVRGVLIKNSVGVFLEVGNDVVLPKGKNFLASNAEFIVESTVDGKIKKGFRGIFGGGIHTTSGKVVDLKAFRQVAATPSVYTEAAADIAFQKTYVATLSAKSHVVVGNIGNVLYGRKISANSSTYEVDQLNTNTLYGKKTIAISSSVNLTGIATSFAYGKAVAASQGDFLVTVNVGTIKGFKTIVSSGVLSIVGNNIATVAARHVTIGQNQYRISFAPTRFDHQFVLTSAAGSTNVTFEVCSLVKGIPMPASSGNLAIGSFASLLVKATSTGYNTGKFFTNGGSALLKKNELIVPGPSGLDEMEDTWLTDPVAESIYKGATVTTQAVDVSELEVLVETSKKTPANIAASISVPKATAETPQKKEVAKAPEVSVEVRQKPAKTISAKIREYR